MPDADVEVTATFLPIGKEQESLPFVDVTEEDWFCDPVSYVYRQVTVSPDRACPMSVLTRPWSLSRTMTLRRTRTEEPPPPPLPGGAERGSPGGTTEEVPVVELHQGGGR